MAVYRLDSLQQAGTENILSELWLTSDLVGWIESPLYYFENKHLQAKEALDNLLLTQGWRRFHWEEVLQQGTPRFTSMPEYEGHILKAVVRDSVSGTPLSGIIASLSVPGRLLQFHTSKSNQQGELFFVTDQFYGQMDIIIQNASIRRKGLIFSLTSPYAQSFTKAQTVPLLLSKTHSELLRQRHVHMQAQNVYWQEELNRLIVPALDSIAFFGAPDKTYKLDDYTRFPTMEEIMREYVYEVRVRKNGGAFTFRVAKPTRDGFYNGLPLILLDGKPVFDVSDLIAYNPLKIQKLDILQERFILGGNMIFDGIISYTSYKGVTDDLPLADDLLQLTYDGLQLQREFYSPTYETAPPANIRMPDFRQLLHWAPDIKLSGKNEQQLQFYTSDLKGTYMLVIQGISQDGRAGTKTLFFDVRDNAF
ncbi:hypothetical protein [Cesiribacter andamanensis]|nr:hypothetical protein [Cesiribacter andamanensis]